MAVLNKMNKVTFCQELKEVRKSASCMVTWEKIPVRQKGAAEAQGENVCHMLEEHLGGHCC